MASTLVSGSKTLGIRIMNSLVSGVVLIRVVNNVDVKIWEILIWFSKPPICKLNKLTSCVVKHLGMDCIQLLGCNKTLVADTLQLHNNTITEFLLRGYDVKKVFIF